MSNKTKYIVKAPNGNNIFISNSLGVFNFNHGDVTENTDLAKLYPHIFIPIIIKGIEESVKVEETVIETKEDVIESKTEEVVTETKEEEVVEPTTEEVAPVAPKTASNKKINKK